MKVMRQFKLRRMIFYCMNGAFMKNNVNLLTNYVLFQQSLLKIIDKKINISIIEVTVIYL